MKKILTIGLTTMLAIAVVVGTTMAAGLDQARAVGKLIVPGSGGQTGIVLSNDGMTWNKDISLGELTMATSSMIYSNFSVKNIGTTTTTTSIPVRLSATVDNPNLANYINISIKQYSATGSLIYSYNGKFSDLTVASSTVNFSVYSNATTISIGYYLNGYAPSGTMNYTMYLTQRSY